MSKCLVHGSYNGSLVSRLFFSESAGSNVQVKMNPFDVNSHNKGGDLKRVQLSF